MDFNLFLTGLFIGFMVAVPVGPIGLLCINRALTQGPGSGLISGLGVAMADALAAGIAVFGLTLISNLLMAQEIWLRPLGGLFLCYLGVRTFIAIPKVEARSEKESSLLSACASTFFLTFTNPVTITSFVAVFAAFGIGGSSENALSAAMLIAGVFAGSALWWVILALGLRVLGPTFSSRGLQWVSRVSGAMIAGFGFVVLFDLWQTRF